MKTLDWNSLTADQRIAALERPEQRDDVALKDGVRAIVEDVRNGGWAALQGIARRLDGAEPRLVEVAPIAVQARRDLPADAVEAIQLAARNIRRFHEAGMPADVSIETMPGLTVGKVWRAIDRVGVYVPGGKTPLFSTLLMLAIPAAIAGVRELVVVTPPRADGGLDLLIALAAAECGIERVWTVGGAQAIAALAFGSGKLPKVDKICGPGNAWVAEAKRLVSGMVGGPAIDMPAGPSELMIIADDAADARIVAADLLGQAEHDPAAQVLLVTDSQRLASQIDRHIDEQLSTLPRKPIAKASLDAARIIVVEDLHRAAEVANLYAPEHLSLAVGDPEPLIASIRNAGAVFAGRLAAETFGDYLAGSSHVLPTDGAARAWGGVSVYTFLKAMTVQSLTADATRHLARPAALLARLEGLEAHARAADLRLELVG
ncbi:histidinol dehydrogenase [Sphingomonas flavescens]|uniref:histidinol dehydrogenase n=1 Tax=Sphingomonas flavescens TaxID=3132797 RepID=UPI0028047541|nr:histidinol dehydrogenase [Sphingomonas limnosediminicola]